jgi:hypothetical protein
MTKAVQPGLRPADKADQRDRVSSQIIQQEHTRMVQKTERLRNLRQARDAQAVPKEDAKPAKKAK